mmetsp:Transcript_60933/g.157097  ORF Transcript_60933/g.157097 Transcript_60933/m.157097 type:complete len:209 (-) Transcript_60933:555-1181(-)
MLGCPACCRRRRVLRHGEDTPCAACSGRRQRCEWACEAGGAGASHVARHGREEGGERNCAAGRGGTPGLGHSRRDRLPWRVRLHSSATSAAPTTRYAVRSEHDHRLHGLCKAPAGDGAAHPPPDCGLFGDLEPVHALRRRNGVVLRRGPRCWRLALQVAAASGDWAWRAHVPEHAALARQDRGLQGSHGDLRRVRHVELGHDDMWRRV